jgi:hypothetical protein
MANVAALYERPEEAAAHEARATELEAALRGDQTGAST